MANRVFSPGTVTIAEGATVTFLNDDGRDHTVTARDGSYDSGIMSPSANFTKTYTVAGSYSYFCAIHPDMTGTIEVTDASGAVPAPTPTPPPSTPPGGAAAAGSDVQIIDFGYTPASINVDVGATVVWANVGAALHTVTARDGSFDSGFVSAGGTFSRQFSAAATVEYFCTLHPNMTGTVVVGGAPGAPPPPAAPTPALPPVSAGDVAVLDFSFGPATLTIEAGTSVTWVNQGIAPHTVTSNSGLFDSGIMERGVQYARTFDQPGTFPYFCAIHPDMTATVIVPDSTGAAPPPAAPPPRLPQPLAGNVEVLDFSFAPGTIEVATGTTVRWVNSGIAPHTVTDRGGSFDSGFLNTGEEFALTFDSAGTFEYFCTLHPNMVGTLVVGEGGGPSSPPSSPSSDGGEPAPEPGEVDVVMLDFDYSPRTVSVPVGTTLTWHNAGAALHTVTARDGYFDSGFAAQGDSFSHTFTTPGTFEYFCVIHPQMIATVEVTADGAAPSAAPVASESLAVLGDASAVVTAAIAEFSFTPTTFSVATGTAVRWTNEGVAGHTVTAVDGSFDSGIVRSGQSFARLFTEPGMYEYVCSIYPGMGGTITVEDDAADESGFPLLPLVLGVAAAALAGGLGGAFLLRRRRLA
jgi:plastocyanin